MNDEPVATESIENYKESVANTYRPPTVTTQILKGSDMAALHVEGYEADTYYLCTITNYHNGNSYVDSVEGEHSINIRIRELSDWELDQFKKALGSE